MTKYSSTQTRGRKAGFSLVEVIVAMGVVGVGIVAVLTAVATLSGGAAYTADSVAAAALAGSMMGEVDTRAFEADTPKPTGRVIDDLVAYYPFTDGAGMLASDRSRATPLALLEFYTPAQVKWIPGSNGVTIAVNGKLENSQEASKISSECAKSDQVTVEVWFEPGSLERGEAPIISCATDSGTVNFVLSQQEDGLRFYIRTHKTNADGNPATTTLIRHLTKEVAHCVVTFDGTWVSIFLDGQPAGGSNLPAGNLSSWADHPLRVAKLSGFDVNWIGNVFLIAIYSRALTPEEIQKNYAVGPSPSGLYNRAGYDDIDDYNGYADSPPRAEDGSTITGAEQFSRTVDVVNVAPDDIAAQQDWDSTDAKTITVRVYKNYKLLAELVRARYRGVSTDDMPDPGY
ncbi:MAG: LamG domain-containing protein [Planctomycetes bacterium]|nr:LamG domain-containing protein [Planctomycetota bacterium]